MTAQAQGNWCRSAAIAYALLNAWSFENDSLVQLCATESLDLEQAERRAICERQPTDRRPEASGAAPGESFAENDRRF